jgi:hypothetical protein
MVIREGTDRIEIVATDRVPAHLPTPGDARLQVKVESRGFTGHGTSWVEADRLAIFARQLRALESTRRGEAELEGMSPGEFRLRVYSVDQAGHMAIEGRVSDMGQSLEFGFPFCPSLLRELVAEFESFVLTPP